jgi:Ca2+-binding EF-hand superfamily protein
MTRNWLIGIFGALFALAQVASAADPQKTTAATFESLDKDGDGRVSINEATEHDGLFVAFKNLDKNQDGSLSKEEFEGYQPSR